MCIDVNTLVCNLPKILYYDVYLVEIQTIIKFHEI